MGNCFKASTHDDISLLHDSDVPDNGESSVPHVPPPPPYQEQAPVYHPTSSFSGNRASRFSEDEQIRVAKRLGLIQHLPSGIYDGSKKARECVICMNEFMVGDAIRYLPCLHTYHQDCIDDWLMRSFTCPSCMEPVDAALLMTYETN